MAINLDNVDPKVMRIASIAIGVVISILVLVMGFKILTGAFTRAANEIPTDVTVTSITSTSATINWTAKEGSQAVIVYGTSSSALNFLAPEVVAGTSTSHSVELTLLSPATTYFFALKMGDKTYDNGGAWTFSTKSVEKPVPTAAPASVVSPTARPRSSQTVVISPPAAIPTASSGCSYSDCTTVKQKLGAGCTIQDYFKCVRKLTPITPP